MSRSTPDPVFAAAARAEVEARIRAVAGTAALDRRPRRPWVMELGAVAGIAVLAAGIAVGVHTLQPAFDQGGAPAGSVTQSVPSTADPTASPLPSPTETPTSTPQTAAPPTAPTTETPTEAPTTPPPPSTAPTTPPATSSPLIGPTGAQQRSSAEIRSWALGLGFGEIWAEQAVLDASCMADHGFRYDPEFEHDAGVAAQHAGLTDEQYAAFQVAEYGSDTNLPYDWRTAGCHGRSVHLTGQDGKD